jgi:hypothetical protein
MTKASKYTRAQYEQAMIATDAASGDFNRLLDWVESGRPITPTVRQAIVTALTLKRAHHRQTRPSDAVFRNQVAAWVLLAELELRDGGNPERGLRTKAIRAVLDRMKGEDQVEDLYDPSTVGKWVATFEKDGDKVIDVQEIHARLAGIRAYAAAAGKQYTPGEEAIIVFDDRSRK